jgi:hypothetical protein
MLLNELADASFSHADCRIIFVRPFHLRAADVLPSCWQLPVPLDLGLTLTM